MGLRYEKRGAVLRIYYEGFKRESGLTVEGNFYEPNGSAYSGNPYSFTHLANGNYYLDLTATSTDGDHIGDIDATTAGKSRPGSMIFKVAANSIQDIYNKAVVIDGKVDTLQTDITAIKGTGFVGSTDSLHGVRLRLDEMAGSGFLTANDSLKAIKDLLNTVNSTLNGIEGSVHSTITIEESIVIPESGNVRYQIDLFNYSNTGMKDFDSAPSIIVTASDGNTYTARLYTAQVAGTQQSTMVQVGGSGSGHYRLFFETQSTDPGETELYFLISGVEDGESFSYQRNAEWILSYEAAGVAQESTLTTVKQTTGGTFDRDTDSLEAIRNRVDVLAGTGFSSSTDTLEKLGDALFDAIRYSGLKAH
jgi:hypothetical protein